MVTSAVGCLCSTTAKDAWLPSSPVVIVDEAVVTMMPAGGESILTVY